jgi:hypothetical protein
VTDGPTNHGQAKHRPTQACSGLYDIPRPAMMRPAGQSCPPIGSGAEKADYASSRRCSSRSVASPATVSLNSSTQVLLFHFNGTAKRRDPAGHRAVDSMTPFSTDPSDQLSVTVHLAESSPIDSVARHLRRGAIGIGLSDSAFELIANIGPAALLLVPLWSRSAAAQCARRSDWSRPSPPADCSATVPTTASR